MFQGGGSVFAGISPIVSSDVTKSREMAPVWSHCGPRKSDAAFLAGVVSVPVIVSR